MVRCFGEARNDYAIDSKESTEAKRWEEREFLQYHQMLGHQTVKLEGKEVLEDESKRK